MARKSRKCLYCSADISDKSPFARYCSRSHGSAYRVKGCRPRTAEKAPDWTDQEIEAMRRDPYAPVPGRTAKAIKRKMAVLKIRREATRVIGEPREIRCDRCDTPFIASNKRAHYCSAYCSYTHRRTLQRQRDGVKHRPCKPWTDEEIAAITANRHYTPPGRTRNSVLNYLNRHGIYSKGPGTAWTEQEIAQITANPRAILPDRSEKAIAHKLVQLGLSTPKRRAERRSGAPAATKGPFAGSVLAAASPKTPGFEVFLELNRLCSRNSERDDIVSEAAILMIEGGLSAREAISKATRTVRSFDASKFRHVEYRDEIFHPAGDAM